MLTPTPCGAARRTEHAPVGPPRATVLLLHGAGTDTAVPVLLDLAEALAAGGVLAVRIDQPYTLGPRRPAAPAAQLDAVVRAVAASYSRVLTGVPLLLAGRSSGGRVACRVATSVGAEGLLALGFPLVPPGRRTPVTRAPELAAAGVPVLVVQGSRDGFGTPEDVAALGLPHVAVHAVAGADHMLATRVRDGRSGVDAVAEAVAVSAAWLLARESRRPGTTFT